MDSWTLLIEVVVLLACCLAFGWAFSRFGQNVLVGYLLAGVAIAAFGDLFLFEGIADIEAIAELGVSLLLFSLGLEFSWRRLADLGGRALAAGALQVVLTMACAWAGARALGMTHPEAIAVGAMVSLSSTASVIRVLGDRGETDSAYGRAAIAILLVQDIAVVPLALLVTLLSGQGAVADAATGLGMVLVAAMALILMIYLTLNALARRALGEFSLERNRELAVLLAVVVSLGASWSAHAVGLSPALGAFFAGVVLGGSPFATQIRADVSPFRVVLLTLFFGAVGMAADPAWIVRHGLIVAALASICIVGKALIVWLVTSSLGQPRGIGVATGFSLGQIGEFAFLLGGMATSAGVIGENTHKAVISTGILTLLGTPYLIGWAPRIGAWVGGRKGVRPSAGGPEPMGREGVLIVGYGPAGRAVGRALVDSGVPVRVIDLNADAVRAAEALGFAGDVGDAQQVEVLEHANVAAAAIVVITVPSRSAAMVVLHQVRRLAPDAHVVVRCRHELHRADFESAGAHAVFGDEQEIGSALAGHVLFQRREAWARSDVDRPV